jgi:hypothetical protein
MPMTRYEITVAGPVGPVVRGAFEDCEVVPARDGRSRLVGDLVDQAALNGVLGRLQDLRVQVVEFRRAEDS